MTNIFKTISKAYTSTLRKLELVEQGSEQEQTLLQAKDLLEEIKEYLKSYKWLCKKTAKERVKVFIESGYDYDVLMKKFGITYNNATATITWANNKFKKAIGENTIKLIEQGFIDEARSAFYVGSGKLTKELFISTDGLKGLPEEKFNIFSLEECENELKILSLISKARLEHYFELMDKEKMAYVLWLLLGSSKKSDLYRPYIISLLENNLSASELIEMEEDIKGQQYYV